MFIVVSISLSIIRNICSVLYIFPDDFYTLVRGSVLIFFISFLFIFARNNYTFSFPYFFFSFKLLLLFLYLCWRVIFILRNALKAGTPENFL